MASSKEPGSRAPSVAQPGVDATKQPTPSGSRRPEAKPINPSPTTGHQAAPATSDTARKAASRAPSPVHSRPYITCGTSSKSDSVKPTAASSRSGHAFQASAAQTPALQVLTTQTAQIASNTSRKRTSTSVQSGHASRTPASQVAAQQTPTNQAIMCRAPPPQAQPPVQRNTTPPPWYHGLFNFGPKRRNEHFTYPTRDRELREMNALAGDDIVDYFGHPRLRRKQNVIKPTTGRH